ncbi:ribosome biogenesis GTPase YqeH [Paenibacillus sp.]|uniref:ribosome biogenesis GTPase YqeH n=1 Tax=Paenibacillus sp. TaxID=58172 RepID=UPI002D30A90E|nr:ribosome biogenesis GTPase YqeH [Paenibacillus sp.]HZG57150.1 ribosome biogenesis GTPase YqeH [Paenibacillus sp.]
MSAANTGLKCSGCGVGVQTEEKAALGYVPKAALERKPLVCQRCFRMKHYNEALSVTPNQNEFLRLLGGVGDTDSLVVHIVDIFDFEGSLIGGLQRFVGSNPVVLVVNKIDLLPPGVNPNRIRNWVQRRAKEEGLRTVEVLLVSAKRGTGFERLAETLEAHRRGRDVYIVGATNVGKSTLVNRLIADYSDLDAEVTVSSYPGTTLDLIHIPLDDEASVIDTPGIVYETRLTERVPKRYLEGIVPSRPVKPASYQLDAEQTLFFGALARFDFVEGAHQSFTCYVSPALTIHRTKLAKADALYAEHAGELLQPPAKEDLSALPPLTRHRFRVKPGTDVDLYIAGLGWIRANGTSGATVDVHAPKGVKVIMRDALI